MSVARLTVEDAEELRELRREALLAHPTAFSADPEIEAKMTIETWRERLRSGRWFGGKIDRTLVGMGLGGPRRFGNDPTPLANWSVTPRVQQSARCEWARVGGL